MEEMQLLIIETEDSKKEEGQGLQKGDRGRLGEKHWYMKTEDMK